MSKMVFQFRKRACLRNPAVVAIMRDLENLERETKILLKTWSGIREACDHPDCPTVGPREIRRSERGETVFPDLDDPTCPDCGYPYTQLLGLTHIR